MLCVYIGEGFDLSVILHIQSFHAFEVSLVPTPSDIRGSTVCYLPLGSNLTEPLPFFTSTTQTPFFPPGPPLTLKQKTPFTLFTYSSPFYNK